MRKYPIPPPKRQRRYRGGGQRWHQGEYRGTPFLRTLWGRIIVTGLLIVGLPFASEGMSWLKRQVMVVASGSPSCDIKGNISASGEHIYHVPGQRYYDVTRISPGKGERWFCSEAEARAAGWRRSRR